MKNSKIKTTGFVFGARIDISRLMGEEKGSTLFRFVSLLFLHALHTHSLAVLMMDLPFIPLPLVLIKYLISLQISFSLRGKLLEGGKGAGVLLKRGLLFLMRSGSIVERENVLERLQYKRCC